jgi:hypothetical protein
MPQHPSVKYPVAPALRTLGCLPAGRLARSVWLAHGGERMIRSSRRRAERCAVAAGSASPPEASPFGKDSPDSAGTGSRRHVAARSGAARMAFGGAPRRPAWAVQHPDRSTASGAMTSSGSAFPGGMGTPRTRSVLTATEGKTEVPTQQMETERSPIRPSDVPADLRAEAGGPVHALAVALRVRANRMGAMVTGKRCLTGETAGRFPPKPNRRVAPILLRSPSLGVSPDWCRS